MLSNDSLDLPTALASEAIQSHAKSHAISKQTVWQSACTARGTPVGEHTVVEHIVATHLLAELCSLRLAACFVLCLAAYDYSHANARLELQKSQPLLIDELLQLYCLSEQGPMQILVPQANPLSAVHDYLVQRHVAGIECTN